MTGQRTVARRGQGAALTVADLATSRPGFLAFHRNGLERRDGRLVIYADRVPSAQGKAALERRKAQLTAALSGSVTGDGMASVLAMLAAMPAAAGDSGTMQARGAAYKLALDDLPGWAVAETVRRVIRGEAGLSLRFAPTPAELRKAVSDSLAPLRAELRQIVEILDAAVIPVPGPRDVSTGGERVTAADLASVNRGAAVSEAMARIRERIKADKESAAAQEENNS